MSYVTMHTDAVLADVAAERLRQDQKWGQQNHPNGTGPSQRIICSEIAGGPTNAELAVAARDRTDRMHRKGRGTYEQILTEEVCEAYAEVDPARLRRELIQVAAVAVAWVEKIDREAS